MILRPFSAGRARQPHEQLSPTEDGLVIFDTLGLCRLEIRGGGQALGAMLLTSGSPTSPYVAERDYWYWSASPWPQVFELRYVPNLQIPNVQPEVHAQLVFAGQASQHDLSSPSRMVWRVRLGELVQGTPAFTELGLLTRHTNGSLAWYADMAPTDGFFAIPEGAWLELTRIPNSGLVVEAVHATPGAIA